MRRHAILVAFAFILSGCALPMPGLSAEDWPQFGWNVERTNAPGIQPGFTASDLKSLKRLTVSLDGTVDSSAIYLQGVEVAGGTHDTFFVTTTYGKTIAVDASTGSVLWEFTPPGYDAIAGTYRITNATPAADPDRKYIYAAAPDGVIRKLSVATGRTIWATAITRLPEREKIASPLGYFNGRVYAATDGYIGDQPPYQGHVAVLDAASGTLQRVWNSLCSDRHELMDPSSCAQSDSGIWGRAGVVIDSGSGNLFVATGNGLWDGRNNWGDSVIELSPAAERILGNFTPTNTDELNRRDADLGSTSPVLLGGSLVAQGGKDGWIRVLDWSRMGGTEPHRGGTASRVPTPGGARLFTAPALLRTTSATWLITADNAGTTAFTLDGDELRQQWSVNTAGTSPVIAGGMAFVYDPNGGLHVYEATSGKELAVLDCGTGHWNSPIAVDGRIALPEGNANNHLTRGTLDIWRAKQD